MRTTALMVVTVIHLKYMLSINLNHFVKHQKRNKMNRITKQVAMLVAGFITFFALLGVAGKIDCAEQIVYTMPQEAYEAICLKLGDGCSDCQIANEYMTNKQYYDSLSQ